MKIAITIIITLVSFTIIPVHAISSCQCVSFRMDDIQNYWIDNSQLAVMELFHHKNASLTVGIIGGSFGTDTKLVNYIKNHIHDKSSPIEVANHGWLHENFTYYSKQKQTELMKKTDAKIKSLFGATPTIFVPPYDKLDDNTISAMKANKLAFVSSSVDDDYGPYLQENNKIMHIPGNVQTGNLEDKDRIWTHHDHVRNFVDVVKAIHENGYALVILHPQEYAIRNHLQYYNEVDKSQIKELGLLIDQIHASGFKIVPVSKIPYMLKENDTPSWMDNLFDYLDNGKISYHDLYVGLKYLLDKRIIQL